MCMFIHLDSSGFRILYFSNLSCCYPITTALGRLAEAADMRWVAIELSEAREVNNNGGRRRILQYS